MVIITYLVLSTQVISLFASNPAWSNIIIIVYTAIVIAGIAAGRLYQRKSADYKSGFPNHKSTKEGNHYESKTHQKLPGKLVNAFIVPNIGLNLFIYLELFYMSYFLTDICGFSLSVVTFILTSTAAVDLVWVFVTGIMLEKCEFKSWVNTGHGMSSVHRSSSYSLH